MIAITGMYVECCRVDRFLSACPAAHYRQIDHPKIFVTLKSLHPLFEVGTGQKKWQTTKMELSRSGLCD